MRTNWNQRLLICFDNTASAANELNFFRVKSKPSSRESAGHSEAISNEQIWFWVFFSSPLKWLTSSHPALCLWKAVPRCWQSVQVFEGSEFPGCIRSPCYMALGFLPSVSLLKMGFWRSTPGALWAVCTSVNTHIYNAHWQPPTWTCSHIHRHAQTIGRLAKAQAKSRCDALFLCGRWSQVQHCNSI